MKFDFGNEQRFVDFVNRISKNDKVAIVSHTDVDGITAAKVVNAVVEASVVKFVNYDQLALPLAEELKHLGVNKIIFSDLYIKDVNFLKALEHFAEVLILDHHLAEHDLNSARTVFIKGEAGYCAGYLCYSLFSKLKNIEHIDWLVACSCVSDYCHVKPATWLASVFEKYEDSFEQVGLYVRTSGPIWDLQETLSLALIYFKDNLNHVFEQIGMQFGEIGNLGKHATEVRTEINRLVNLFEKDREEFPDGYLYEFTPKFACGSMVGSIISGTNVDSTIIVLRFDPIKQYYGLSARRQDKQVNMDAFVKNLLKDMDGADGGGHVAAAGGRFPARHLSEFKKRLGVVSLK